MNHSFFYIFFGEAKVGEKKEDGGGDAHREENKSINCFFGDLVIFSFMYGINPLGAMDPLRIG